MNQNLVILLIKEGKVISKEELLNFIVFAWNFSYLLMA